jgi:type VI secretion system protein ImpG
MAIAECRLPDAQAELVQGVRIPRGSPLETAVLPDGEPLRFRTVYPVSLWPISVASAVLEHQPYQAPEIRAARSSPAVLRIGLRSYGPAVDLGQISLPSLRFFLNGQPPYVYDLYEVLLNNVSAVTLSAPGAGRALELDPRSTIRAVGFDPDESALPHSPRELPGYNLLTEVFCFPQKLLFLDIAPPAAVWREQKHEAELLFFLDREVTPLVPSVSAATFRLGCTPIINLYTQTAEPIRVHHATSEYRIVPDARRPKVHEVHSIDRVTATASGGRVREYHPFYSFRRGDERYDNPCYWLTSRRLPAGATGTEEGSDVFLELVDLNFQPAAPDDVTLKIETTCVTRDGQRLRFFENGLPRLQLQQQDAALVRIQCLTRPTPVLRPVIGRGTRWRLLSHLAVNGLSLRDLDAGADGLREILRLYHLREDKRGAEMIAGLVGVRFARATGRVSEVVGGRRQEFVCRGHDVTLEFDETRYTAGGLYLFASVLDRFLGSYCSVNSFVQTTATTRQRGTLVQWARRAGDQILL